MRPKARITLTEAITSLALGKALTAAKLKVALSDDGVGLTREDIFKLTEASVICLCDAGFSGQVVCWGKRGIIEHLDASTSSMFAPWNGVAMYRTPLVGEYAMNVVLTTCGSPSSAVS